MLLKITEPFATAEIEAVKGNVTNIVSNFHKYTITENGTYLLSSFYHTNSIVEFFKKTATTINVYSTSPTVAFHPLESASLTVEKWNEIKKFASQINFNDAFELFDTTDFDNAFSIFIPTETKRQFLIFKIEDIAGSVVINQCFTNGTNNKPLMQL